MISTPDATLADVVNETALTGIDTEEIVLQNPEEELAHSELSMIKTIWGVGESISEDQSTTEEDILEFNEQVQDAGVLSIQTHQELLKATRERRSTSPGRHAVNEAMTIAPYIILQRKIEGKRNTAHPIQERGQSLDELYERWVAEECQTASLAALMDLAEHRADLFEEMCLIRADNDKTRPFKQDPTWSFHTYFLVKDKEGVWYSGSPANHIRNATETPLTRVFENASLEEILEEIASVDGGVWPTAEYIKEQLQAAKIARSKMTVPTDHSIVAPLIRRGPHQFRTDNIVQAFDRSAYHEIPVSRDELYPAMTVSKTRAEIDQAWENLDQERKDIQRDKEDYIVSLELDDETNDILALTLGELDVSEDKFKELFPDVDKYLFDYLIEQHYALQQASRRIIEQELQLVTEEEPYIEENVETTLMKVASEIDIDKLFSLVSSGFLHPKSSFFDLASMVSLYQQILKQEYLYNGRSLAGSHLEEINRIEDEFIKQDLLTMPETVNGEANEHMQDSGQEELIHTLTQLSNHLRMVDSNNPSVTKMTREQRQSLAYLVEILKEISNDAALAENIKARKITRRYGEDVPLNKELITTFGKFLNRTLDVLSAHQLYSSSAESPLELLAS